MILNNIKKYLKKLTLSREKSKIPSIHEVSTTPTREVTSNKPITDSLICPYCHSPEFQRRGFRQNVHEKVQLYLCEKCQKTFTQKEIKGKHYPLAVIFDAISIYNLGYSLEETCKVMEKRMQQKTRSIADSLTVSHSDEATPGLSENSISINKNFVKSQNTKGVDPGGIAPPRTGLTDQTPHLSEPTPNLLSQNKTAPVNQQSTIIQPSTLSGWLEEFQDYLKYSRMRGYAMKLYSPKDTVVHATLVHQQLYHYLFHKAKCELIIKDGFQHRHYWPLKEFLEAVPYECPHQYFQPASTRDGEPTRGGEGLRASEAPLTFSKTQMIVRSKTNYANSLAAFVLQSVTDRKKRHEALQKFMLANDSVTVAAEVPVYLTKDDLLHLKTQLGFEIYTKKIDLINLIPNSPKQAPNTNDQIGKLEIGNSLGQLGQLDQLEIRNSNELPKLITGHIDLIQIRNGQIHILDYKPNAAKERPIEQLTLYAMALSRLTGLRLFEFKCAWFDEKDYFEFYPLHVIHKLTRTRRRKITTIEGVYKINQNRDKIENLKPDQIITNS